LTSTVLKTYSVIDMYNVMRDGRVDSESTSVLVTGGGTVGLSAAMFLAFQGVKTVLVERHSGIPPHPRAVGWTPRTMELFRTVGIAQLLPERAAGGGGGGPPGRMRIESLAGEWFEESSWTPGKAQGRTAAQADSGIEYSPHGNAGLPQNKLEPILRDRAVELGADIRFQTELVSFDQDDEGVTALLRKQDGSEYSLRAAYMIAADGNRSPTREALGLGRQGRGFIQNVRSIMFRASIDKKLVNKIEALRAKGVVQFQIDQPDLKGMLGYIDGRWMLYLSDDKERDAASVRTVVIQALGISNCEPQIITADRWEASAFIADRFTSGRVFLVGDAAHALPPNRGGYGANTGIEDAQNLAWKLAAVLSDASFPRLLDTYDAERRPIAWLRHQQIFNRPDYAAYADDTMKVPIIDDIAMDLGQLYRSTAVLGAGDDLQPALRPDQWAGQPGTRAPHLWVTRNGERISTLDLFQRDWVLLAEDERWCDAAAQASGRLGVKVDCKCIGVDLVAAAPEAFRTAFGIGPSGAALVRPDGYIAWRSMDLPVDAARALTNVLQDVAAAASKPREQI
jgi:putative polyketide hydroxylase